jgi:hypothetical protein
MGYRRPIIAKSDEYIDLIISVARAFSLLRRVPSNAGRCCEKKEIWNFALRHARNCILELGRPRWAPPSEVN